MKGLETLTPRFLRAKRHLPCMYGVLKDLLEIYGDLPGAVKGVRRGTPAASTEGRLGVPLGTG